MSDSIIIQRPDGQAGQLFLLFHGSGSSARDMEPVGAWLANEFPIAFIVSVNAPLRADIGLGYQWFSVAGINESERKARVKAAMPQFLDTIKHWRIESGVAPAATAIIGFSQGAIMALETSSLEEHIAGRLVAIAGRFAGLPPHARSDTTLHLIHGKQDPVIPYQLTIEAAEHIIDLGGDITADIIPFIGHEINEEVMRLMIKRLKSYVPKRMWEEALRSAPRD